MSKIVLKNLRRLRKEKGYTQKKLAEEAGFSQNTICCYEKGYRIPRARELEKIVSVLGCKIEDLFFERNSLEKKVSMTDLQEAARPLVSLLKEKGHPLITAIVTSRGVDLLEAVMGTPFEYDD